MFYAGHSRLGTCTLNLKDLNTSGELGEKSKCRRVIVTDFAVEEIG